MCLVCVLCARAVYVVCETRQMQNTGGQPVFCKLLPRLQLCALSSDGPFLSLLISPQCDSKSVHVEQARVYVLCMRACVDEKREQKKSDGVVTGVEQSRAF
jgi:hypothetical protein